MSCSSNVFCKSNNSQSTINSVIIIEVDKSIIFLGICASISLTCEAQGGQMPLQYLFLKIETSPIFPVLLTSLFLKLKFLISMVNFCSPPPFPTPPPLLLAKLRLCAQEIIWAVWQRFFSVCFIKILSITYTGLHTAFLVESA
jgi:hypothetical protein